MVLFSSTPYLVELVISSNFISGESLKELSNYFPNMKNIETLNFSSNWIDSYCMEDFIENAFIYIPSVKSIDLSNNFLDNEFLKGFDSYLRKHKSEKQITFDLSKNRFDAHLSKYKFSNHNEEDNSLIMKIDKKQEKTYSLMHFVENLS